jgi:hypothetical protein
MQLNSISPGPPGPRRDEGRDLVLPASAIKQLDDESSYDHDTSFVTSSQQVSWWEVHLYRKRILKHTGIQQFPAIGTPAWCALSDDHPAKHAAALDAAQHWALRIETAQAARCDAAQAISASENWAAVAKANRDRAEFIAANPWARRVIA